VAGVTRFDAVVVGAGFAGLSAAVRLARGGVRVLVLETRPRLGGRATTFEDRETGERVDNGQHVLLGCYRETFAFLADLDVLDRVRRSSQLRVAMIDRRGRRSRLVCPTLPPPLHLLAGVLEWDALSWADRLSVLRMRTPLRLARRELEPGARTIAASPDETVENWLVRNGQTPRLREMLWDPLALAALNQPPAEAAAAPFARVLAEMFGSDPQAAAIAVPVVHLDQLYAEPARAFIESRGGSVRTGRRASIALGPPRAASGAPTVASVTDGDERWTPAAVVAAVPWHALPDLFEGDPGPLEPLTRRCRAMGCSPIVTANLWFDRPLFDEPYLGLPGRTMQWAFDNRTIEPRTPLVSMVASGAPALLGRPNAEIVAMAHRELLEALPLARAARLLRAGVVREPRATFSLAPGQPPRPPIETAVEGLYLAGDWIATGLPATIESAVRSGREAAARILR
jgi:squalene-associated FAD-dependent desaturase